MENLLALVGIGLVTFAATNIDDIFVLVAFFSDPTFKRRHVVLGQYLGIGTLILASMACALAAVAIPSAYIRLMGLGPIMVGVLKLLARSEPDVSEPLPSQVQTPSRMLAVAVVTVANGGDNLGVYIPLFATRGMVDWAVLTVVFLALVGVWCAIGYYFVNHPTVGKPVRRYGHLLLPWVLIGLGIYILAQ